MRIDASFTDVKERVLRIQKLDSAGRTKEQREAMEQNEIRPVKLSDAVKEIHAIVAEEQNIYPRVMFRLALKDGKPDGDIANPSYPLPWDLAVQLGLDKLGFVRLNHTSTSVGNVVVKLPYITRTVGAANDDLSVDVEAARKEEAELRAEGWVSDVNLLTKYFPGVRTGDGSFDPLPAELLPKKGK